MKAQTIGALVLVFTVAAGIAYWGWQREVDMGTRDTIQVVASFYPLAEFAHQVGGSAVEVITVVPPGTEPHDYEPTPQELARVYQAAAFIYNGGGVDPWAERIAPELKEKEVRAINMSEAMPRLAAPTGFDPHFWLDPVLAQKQVEIIRDALMAIDPDQATAFATRSAAYVAQLKALDQEYQRGLQSCARRDIVTSHAAFGYVAKRYNLSVITLTGLSPEEEPSARAVSEIAHLAREKNIQYIFFETLVSPKLAETVAAEVGARTLVFNPLEGLTEEEKQAGKDYLTVMRDNLQNLRIALDCR